MLCLRDSIRDDDPSVQRLLRVLEDAGHPLKAGHRYTTMVSGLESRGRQ
jgi:hypothetical protein